jgi:hypothetical protein
MSTAKLLNDCMLATHAAQPKSEWSVERMAGLPYSELIRQCLTSVGHDPQDLAIPMIETNLIVSMVEIDNSPIFQDVLALQKIISWSMSILKPEMSHHEEIAVISRLPDQVVEHNWYDRMILMFRLILDRACVTGDDRPAVEAANSNVLHFVEWWGPAVSGRKLGRWSFLEALYYYSLVGCGADRHVL